MNNAIDQIKRQYIYTVQPVKLFEQGNNNPFQAQKNSFDYFNSVKKSNYNPFHPNVKTDKTAKNLDLLG